jgi:glycosyltransferase involved in cell wall biosynthesis
MIKIVMLLDNPYTNDGRVEREAETLAAAGYKVLLFCVKNQAHPNHEIINGVVVRRVFDPEIHDFWKTSLVFRHCEDIIAEAPQVIHCHDQLMLHLGARLKKSLPKTVLIYDSHELFHSWPLNITDYSSKMIFLKSWIVRKYQILREKRNAHRIDHLITVNTSIAEILTRYFQLKNKAVVIRNIPVKLSFTKIPGLIRKKFDIPENTRILVFIGSAIYPKTLNLEQVIDEIGDQPDLAFVIIAGEQGGKKDIVNYVKHKEFQNIYFHPKVPFDEISTYLSTCDVGLVPTYNKTDLSYWLALDNKLFEYIHAGIPVLAAAQPEIAAIVNTYNVGVAIVPDHANAYLDGLKEILAHLQPFKDKCVETTDVLNWQIESKTLINLYHAIDAELSR